MTNTDRQVSVLEQEFSTSFLGIMVNVSFIAHDEDTIEITGCCITDTGAEILIADVRVREFRSVEFISAEKYLENEAVTYLRGEL